MKRQIALIAAVFSLGLTACQSESTAPASTPTASAAKPAAPAAKPAVASPATPAASKASAEASAKPATAGDVHLAEAKTMYATRCASCHGTTGIGDGVAAAALKPKPRNFAEAAWQSSVKDDHIAKIIVEGGAAVGKSPLMPPNPDLKGKTELVNALVKVVRGFQK